MHPQIPPRTRAIPAFSCLHTVGEDLDTKIALPLIDSLSGVTLFVAAAISGAQALRHVEEAVMVSVASFFRKTPAATLNEYLRRHGIAMPTESGPTRVSQPLMGAFEGLDEDTQSRITAEMGRISSMADEAGQVALYCVTQRREYLDGLANGHERALWTFLNDTEAFRQAEDVRYTDEHRRGRRWDGFVADRALPVSNRTEALERFKERVLQQFGSKNVHVDLFRRHRLGFKDQQYQLVQATVYRDGRLDDVLEFVDGKLDRKAHRPVYEAALTYEPSTGVIEVVAGDRHSRETFVRLFAAELLGIEFKKERLPLRRFNLDKLCRPFDFPTDPEDGIESVQVNELRLMPMDTAGERVTLECSREAPGNIWDMSQDHFGSSDPLLGDWMITRVKLTIRFHPVNGSNRRRTLPLRITMPHGCDLKERTEQERLIGEKYLRQWGLFQEFSVP